MSGRPLDPGRILSVVLLMLLVTPSAHAQGQAKALLVASGLSEPVTVAAPIGDGRLFVVERAGRVRVVENGVPLATPFLDIHTRVSTTGEEGMLGLAFPADYATSGFFTVYYTDLAGDSIVSRFSVSGNRNVADDTSEELLLAIDQPDAFTNHRGGTIHYGSDGFLWFATGDGGGSYDPDEHAQDPSSLLGKMLRIDVGPTFAPDSIPVAGESYRIPADNPFVGTPARAEIWALGLRNPFRWSFDRLTGDLWIGDVGQSAREEIDFERANDPGGRNYGWDVMEGTLCNGVDPALAPPCNAPSLTRPVFTYDHGAGDCSIIGGFVYRSDSSALRGQYFFGDYCTGSVWSLDPQTLTVVDRTAQLGAAAGNGSQLVSFGEDGFGRLLLVRRVSGTVYRISAATPPSPGCGLGPELVVVLAALAGLRRQRRSGPASA